MHEDLALVLHEVQQQLHAIISQLSQGSANKNARLSSLLPSRLCAQHAKRADVEQQNNVLYYEVALLTGVLNRLGIGADGAICLEVKEELDIMVRSKARINELEAEVAKLGGQLKKAQEEKQNLQGKIQQMENNAKVGLRKVEQINKLGGISRINELKKQVREISEACDSLRAQKSIIQEQNKKLARRCQILETLNKQTQEKLCQLMVRSGGENVDPNLPRQSVSERSNPQKHPQNAGVKQITIELMAAKQEIRAMGQRIRQLEQQRQRDKQAHLEKQEIYSKVLSRKDKQLISI